MTDSVPPRPTPEGADLSQEQYDGLVRDAMKWRSQGQQLLDELLVMEERLKAGRFGPCEWCGHAQ